VIRQHFCENWTISSVKIRARGSAMQLNSGVPLVIYNVSEVTVFAVPELEADLCANGFVSQLSDCQKQ
jgi:hypothetical protein